MGVRDSRETYNAYQKEWKRRNAESVKTTRRKQTIKRRGNPHYLAWYAAYRLKKRDKIRARRLLNNAIKRHGMKRGSCEVCAQPNAEGHHEDYDKPLEVRWFCKIHHEQHHRPGTSAV